MEVDLILVNSKPVDFNYPPSEGDRISVYPVFESMEIENLNKLRPKPLRETKFIADVHLGKLARYLRIFGFDTFYETDLDDHKIVEISKAEKRIVLTRDINLLKHGKLTHGIWIRNQNSKKQLAEVIQRLQLESKISFPSRCSLCNGELQKVQKNEISGRLLPLTKEHYNEFYLCPQCDKLYWKGSHYDKIIDFIRKK